MTCRQFFAIVSAVIGEEPDDRSAEPMLKRLVPLVNMISTDFAYLDRSYRRMVLGEDIGENEPVAEISTLDDELGLCDRMIPPLTYGTAAMLVTDENSELAHLLLDSCDKAVNKVIAELPGEVKATRNVYD